MNQSSLTAVQGFNGTAGATVWWTLRGDVRLDTLAQHWQQAGLPADWLPDLPTADKRLGRAVTSVSELRKLARPVERRGHWAIVAEVVEGDGDAATLRHAQVLSVRLEAGEPHFTDAGLTSQSILLSAQIRSVWDAQEGLLHRDDVALWLSKLIARVYGTPLRSRGGLYYVLPSQVERWRAITSCVEAAGAGSTYTLPTLAGEDATRAVLDALARDVADDVQQYTDQILSGNQGPRALRARVRDCDTLLERLTQYDALLGGALDTVRQSVLTAQELAVVAALRVEAAEEEAAGK